MTLQLRLFVIGAYQVYRVKTGTSIPLRIEAFMIKLVTKEFPSLSGRNVQLGNKVWTGS